MKKDVNKQLQSDDKTVKTDKKSRKKIDKIFIFSVSAPIILVVLIVLILTIPDPVRAAVQLKGAEDFIEKGDISIVVINSASETAGILNDKEAVLRGNEAELFAENLSSVLNNVKYSDTETVKTGIWKIKIILYNAIKEYELYIDKDGVYIENKGRLICYDFGDGETSQHEKLLSDIQEYLDN